MTALPRIGALSLAAVAVSACAAPGTPAGQTAAGPRDPCPPGDVWSCVERMGKPVRCFCADKDTMRELLEPTVEGRRQ